MTTRRTFLRTVGITAGSTLAGMSGGWCLEAKSPAIGKHAAFRVGPFTQIYDPSAGKSELWYINDHTFIRAEDTAVSEERWHLFGITHAEPANPMEEKMFAHATAPKVDGPWATRAPVMQVDESKGETIVWAPYVLRHDGRYWMFYCAGGKDHTQYHIHLATSHDLFHWKRHTANPMVVDGYDARDPMVLAYKDGWILYYAATSTPGGGHHTVKAVTSKDLIHWTGMREVYRDSEIGTYGGPTESPFVVERNGKFYLFVCTNHGYSETIAYKSDTPFHFEARNSVGKFAAHAAEIIHTPTGKWYASRAGWGQGGVYLAELVWQD